MIYRAELPDGGGPFYHKDGTPRDINMPVFHDDGISGMPSYESLKKIIEDRYKLNLDDYIIKTYSEDDVEIMHISKETGEIVFKLK